MQLMTISTCIYLYLLLRNIIIFSISLCKSSIDLEIKWMSVSLNYYGTILSTHNVNGSPKNNIDHLYRYQRVRQQPLSERGHVLWPREWVLLWMRKWLHGRYMFYRYRNITAHVKNFKQNLKHRNIGFF